MDKWLSISIGISLYKILSLLDFIARQLFWKKYLIKKLYNINSTKSIFYTLYKENKNEYLHRFCPSLRSRTFSSFPFLARTPCFLASSPSVNFLAELHRHNTLRIKHANSQLPLLAIWKPRVFSRGCIWTKYTSCSPSWEEPIHYEVVPFDMLLDFFQNCSFTKNNHTLYFKVLFRKFLCYSVIVHHQITTSIVGYILVFK